MGDHYSLYRLKTPVGPEGESCDLLEELTRGLTFGPVEDVKRRLFDANVYGVDLLSADSPGRVISSSHEESGLLGDLVDPSTGEPVVIPEREHLQIRSGDGRLLDITFWGDPVERISFCKPSPRDLLPIVDTLPELAPFGIWCSSENRVCDPSRYRSGPPVESSRSIVSTIPLKETPFPSTRGLRWAVKASTFPSSRNPAVARDGRIFLPVGAALVAMDLETGAVAWTREWRSGGMLVTATPAAVIVAGDDPSVYALVPDSGEVLWDVDIKGRVTAAPALIAEDTIAFGTEGRSIYAFQSSTGRVLWCADWIPGPLYTRLATSGSEVIATASDGDRGVVYAFPSTPRDAPPAAHHVEGRMVNERAYWMESMLEVAAAGRQVFVLSTHQILRLSLPDLADPRVVDEFDWDTGFERFIVALDDRLLAYAISTGHNEGVVRVVEADSLQRRYEIPLSHTTSEAVVLDDRRFALVLRPFRHDAKAEGQLLIVEKDTGTIMREMPLGFAGQWQDAYVSAAENALLTMASYGTYREPKSVLGCWQID